MARISYNRDVLLYIQQQIRIKVQVDYVFTVKINLYLKMKYAFESFHQPAVTLSHSDLKRLLFQKFECCYTYFLHIYVVKNV